jgi:hypothetical protein
MKNSWTKTFRRLAAGAIVAGASAFYSAQSYAVTFAFDSASDPAYNDGWQGQTHDDFGNQLTTGDNGGFGFTQWNFDSSYWWYGDPNRVFMYAGAPNGTGAPTWGFTQIDNGLQGGTQFSNPHNSIGRAWAIGQTATLKDVVRAGRGFSPLQVGQTLSVTFDNPTERPLGGGFTGYDIKLIGNTGGTDGNICNGFGGNCTAHNPPEFPSPEMSIDVFQGPGGDPGGWHVNDSAGADTLLNDTDTSPNGAVLTVTRTGTNTYDILLDPIGAGPTYSASRTFGDGSVPIDWIELQFYNASGTATPTGYSDTTPTLAEAQTDFYVSNMQITGVPEPGTGLLLVLGAGLLLGVGRATKR